MLAMLERQPWALLGYARTLAEAQIRINKVQAPAELPGIKQTLATRIDAAALRPQLRDFARRILDGLPAGDRLCHGDFHPGNMLVGAQTPPCRGEAGRYARWLAIASTRPRLN
jgi:hypothetical protein